MALGSMVACADAMLMCCEGGSLAMQAVHHGFGITVLPNELAPVNKEPIKAALLRVLREPTYLVSDSHIAEVSVSLSPDSPCLTLTLPFDCCHVIALLAVMSFLCQTYNVMEH